MKTIDRNQVFALLPIEACINVMRGTFFKLSKKASIQYLRKAILLPDNGIFGLMPAYLDDQYFGAKVITFFPVTSLPAAHPSGRRAAFRFSQRRTAGHRGCKRHYTIAHRRGERPCDRRARPPRCFAHRFSGRGRSGARAPRGYPAGTSAHFGIRIRYRSRLCRKLCGAGAREI
jgi:hypothetical protein